MLPKSLWVRPFQWNHLCTVLSVPFACLTVMSQGCVQRSFNPSAGQVRGSTVDASELQRLDNRSVQAPSCLWKRPWKEEPMREWQGPMAPTFILKF